MPSKVTVLAYLVAFPLLLLCPKSSTANTVNVVDSLQQVLVHTSKDTSRVLLLIDLIYEINVADFDQCLAYADEALELSRQLNYKKGIGHYYYGAGYIYHLKEDHDKAEELYNQSAIIFEELGLEKNLSESYGRLGHLYALRAEYQKSLDIYEKALALSKKNKDDHNSSIIIFSMADNYTHLGQTNEAFKLLKECKLLITHRPHLINYYAILGSLYSKVGDMENSLDALFKSIDICVEYEDTLRMAYVFHTIALTYSDLGDYENGAKYYFTTIELNEKIASPVLTIVSYLGLGELYRLWEDYPASHKFYNQALTAAISEQLNEKITLCHKGIGETFAAEQKYEEALESFKQALASAENWKLLEEIINSRVHIGKMLIELNRNNEAINMLSNTLPLIPSEWEKDCTQSALYGALGAVYLKQKDHHSSMIHLNKGLPFAQRCTKREELEYFYQQLTLVHQANQNFPLAFSYNQKYNAVRDSLLNAENSKLLLAMRIQFETKEKEKAIDLLQKEQKLQTLNLVNQKAELNRKEAYLLALILLLGTSVLLFYLFFNRYKWRKKMEQLDFENRQIALEQKHLKTCQQLEMAQLRSNFFTDVSHEIRTPLTLILTPVEELLATTNGSPQRKSYELIQRNANRLMQLVNQTLDFAKLESGHLPLQLEQYNLVELVHALSNQFRPLLNNKNIELEINNKATHPVLSCDLDQIQKAISNILNNAIEHTNSGGLIKIELENVATQKDAATPSHINLRIQDNGKGIPAEHLTYIFDRFYQVDQKRRSGSGIGLALTKQIVQLHQGSIEVESIENQMTQFTLQFPVSINGSNQMKVQQLYSASDQQVQPQNGSRYSQSGISVSAPAHQYQRSRAIEGASILVVEDHLELSDYISRCLSDQGYKVSQVSNGAEALKYCISNNPELIISDVMMPNMDGFTFTNRLKSDLKTCHIPIILLTAKASQKSKLEGLEIGADDYLTKPFQVEELLVRSKNLIDQRRKLQVAFKTNPKTASKNPAINVMDEKFLKRAFSLVEQNLDDSSFNVERFCREIGMSHTNLYNKIKALTGQNISNFIRSIRLQKAAKLIESNSGNIFEIALLVGFNSRQSFNKAFKDHFGASPTAFRNRKRKQATNLLEKE